MGLVEQAISLGVVACVASFIAGALTVVFTDLRREEERGEELRARATELMNDCRNLLLPLWKEPEARGVIERLNDFLTEETSDAA